MFFFIVTLVLRLRRDDKSYFSHRVMDLEDFSNYLVGVVRKEGCNLFVDIVEIFNRVPRIFPSIHRRVSTKICVRSSFVLFSLYYYSYCVAIS